MGRRKDLRSIFNHSVVYTISKTFLSIDNRRTHDAQDIHIPLYQTFISIIHTSLRSKHYPTRSFLLIIQHTRSDDTRREQLTRKREEKKQSTGARRDMARRRTTQIQLQQENDARRAERRTIRRLTPFYPGSTKTRLRRASTERADGGGDQRRPSKGSPRRAKRSVAGAPVGEEVGGRHPASAKSTR